MVANPDSNGRLGTIICAIRANRMHKIKRIYARKSTSYTVHNITANVSTVNFLDVVELLDKVFKFHVINTKIGCCQCMRESIQYSTTVMPIYGIYLAQ